MVVRARRSSPVDQRVEPRSHPTPHHVGRGLLFQMAAPSDILTHQTKADGLARRRPYCSSRGAGMIVVCPILTPQQAPDPDDLDGLAASLDHLRLWVRVRRGRRQYRQLNLHGPAPCRPFFWPPLRRSLDMRCLSIAHPRPASCVASCHRSTRQSASALPSTTKSTECKPTIESTAESKLRSESAVEGEGAGSESTMEAEATTESKPTTESTAEAASAKAASAKAASAKAASAKADCGKAVTAGVRDAEGAAAGKGRRSERRTGCRNRQGNQTNRYLVHHDAHPFFRAPQPSFRNQTGSS
jgi:hypothetical protein